MISKASARYLRVSTRKTRKVIDLIRGLPVLKAEAIINTLNKRPAGYIRRVLRSAIDSAEKRFHVSAANLYISLIKADQGPMIKRFRAASMGRATQIKHRTTHIILELDKIKVPEKKITAIDTKPAKKTETKKTKSAGKGVKSGTKSTSV